MVHPKKIPHLEGTLNGYKAYVQQSPHCVVFVLPLHARGFRSIPLRCRSSQPRLTLLEVTDVRFHPGTSLTAVTLS